MSRATILVLAYLPYYLNDFVNIAVTDYTVWVLIDYAMRFGILAFLLLMLRRGALDRAALGLSWPPVTDLILWTVGTSAVAMAYLWLSEFVLAPYYPTWALGGVPLDTASPLFRFDATAGLVLVAVSEELVCRGLALSVLRPRLSTPALYAVSALLFSLMHWSLSAHTLTDAFVYGLILTPAVLATGSVWPSTIVHFLINFVLYNM
ncbi:CPBP family intramembrane metalloprotease [Pseudodesulfovibrio sp. F-1]|uniref:CPBP family intramembrane metalloprotease n=1 Tax=Pseudodesulfovibrio alkaliphilus TaxID=2661613 RepID=A0A7K1KN76_9BACT|nr:type II CAAX endopeptidase family protein [Pseudodesulfovibrio alkaliphilus]MUM77500.1 CPBP family intramembrane metalloprotease [Pseudodesulfovibrio alkaliphilus]